MESCWVNGGCGSSPGRAGGELALALSWSGMDSKSHDIVDPMFNEHGALLVYKEHALPEEMDTIREGIIHEAVNAKMGRMKSFNFLVKDSHGRIVAGVIGYTMYGLMYIDSLWVDSKFRGKKWATRLIEEAEKLAKERKCKFVCLFTMCWQALPLYEKQGYYIEHVREGLDRNTKMYLLRKDL